MCAEKGERMVRQTRGGKRRKLKMPSEKERVKSLRVIIMIIYILSLQFPELTT